MSNSSGDGADVGDARGADTPAWGTGDAWTPPHVPPEPALPFPEAVPSEPAHGHSRHRHLPAVLIGAAVAAVVAIAAALLLWRTNDPGPAAGSLGVEPAPAPVV
jgi:hypothetical protein